MIIGFLYHCPRTSPSGVRTGIHLLRVGRGKSPGCRASPGARLLVLPRRDSRVTASRSASARAMSPTTWAASTGVPDARAKASATRPAGLALRSAAGAVLPGAGPAGGVLSGAGLGWAGLGWDGGMRDFREEAGRVPGADDGGAGDVQAGDRTGHGGEGDSREEACRIPGADERAGGAAERLGLALAVGDAERVGLALGLEVGEPERVGLALGVGLEDAERVG